MNRTIIFILLSTNILSACSTNQTLEIDNRQIDSLKSQTYQAISLADQSHKENIRYKSQIEVCQNELRESEKRFNNLNYSLDKQNKSLLAVKENLISKLRSINYSGIEVAYRGGMLFISMTDDFMFASASTKLCTSANQVLAVIANILHEYPDLSAIVVGNTDTLHIKKPYKDNWTLSTERANSIVRTLQNEYGADPSRLIPAGKAEFNPVASNSTIGGMAKNRRIYIIFNPDYNSLWLLSQKYP